MTHNICQVKKNKFCKKKKENFGHGNFHWFFNKTLHAKGSLKMEST
jgi:hypothetical protein